MAITKYRPNFTAKELLHLHYMLQRMTPELIAPDPVSYETIRDRINTLVFKIDAGIARPSYVVTKILATPDSLASLGATPEEADKITEDTHKLQVEDRESRRKTIYEKCCLLPTTISLEEYEIAREYVTKKSLDMTSLSKAKEYLESLDVVIPVDDIEADHADYMAKHQATQDLHTPVVSPLQESIDAETKMLENQEVHKEEFANKPSNWHDS